MNRHVFTHLITLTLLLSLASNIKIGYALTTTLINEIEYNPTGTDSGNEWIELFNPSTQTVSLSGWTVETSHGITYRVTLPSTASISPNGYYIITKTTQWLDNEADYIILKDKNGVEVDKSPALADTANNGSTWQRYPNGRDTGQNSDWIFRSATKGASNGVLSTLTVVSSNGGESWVRGTAHTLTWTSTGSPGANVKIELLRANVVNRVISASTPNDGSFSWTIPAAQVAGTDYRIRITSTTNTAITDSSNANFAITIGALTVTVPNTAVSWVRGTAHTLTWTSTGSPGTNVKIELLKAGVVNLAISASTPNDGSYSWTIPASQTLRTDYKIRVTSTTNTAITDSSNINFAITIGTLTVTSPNGGENWIHGTAHTLTWTSSGSPGTLVKIELLKAGVWNRTIVASTANDGSYSWTIPSTQMVGFDYKIRVTSTTNTALTDSSNNNSIIT